MTLTSSNAAFIFDPNLSNYQLSETHPFKPLRLELTRELLQEVGLLTPAQELPLRMIQEDLLLQVHSRAFVEMVKRVSYGHEAEDAFLYGLGTSDNPIFMGMHDAILRVCAATHTAVDAVASGSVLRALNAAGGLHHALKDKASGFCVYNDLAIGIHHAVNTYGLRVAYLDIDAHHGDGVQWLFYDNPNVMTISLHESGQYLFPGTGHTYELGKGAGRGLSVNVPLEPFTEDDSFLHCFDTVVPKALEFFQPDVLVLQAGADMHRFDPLADLSLSMAGLLATYERVSALADRFCGGRLVATGGGGYDTFRTVPRAWALLWAVVSRQDVPSVVPVSWREQWQAQSPVPLPETFMDEPWEATPRRAEISSHNHAVAERVLSSLAPIWQELQQHAPS